MKNDSTQIQKSPSDLPGPLIIGAEVTGTARTTSLCSVSANFPCYGAIFAEHAPHLLRVLVRFVLHICSVWSRGAFAEYSAKNGTHT